MITAKERLQNMKSIELVHLTKTIQENLGEIKNNPGPFGCKTMDEWIELVEDEMIYREIVNIHAH